MKVQVSVNNVRIIEPSILNENEYNIHECEFEFTEEYNGLSKKAIFTTETGAEYVVSIVNDKCSIPSEVLKEKEFIKLGVYAYDVENEELVLRYSPKPTEFYVQEGSYKNAGGTPPTPSEIEQLQAQITHNRNDIEEIQDNINDIIEQQAIQDETIQNNTEAIEVIDETIEIINGNIENLQEEQVEQNRNIQANADDIEEIKAEQITQNTNIQKNTDDIVNINQAIDTINTDITNIDSAIGDINENIDNLEQDLTNYSLITETGSQINLNVNSTNYQITAILKDKNGNVIYTSNVIDLPIESMIVNARYDNQTKEIVLTLQNGNTLRISVADLISGLVSETQLQTILANYYTKTEVDNLLSNLAGRVSTNEEDIADIKEEQTTQNADIEELQNQVETLQEDLESANSEIEELNTDITNMAKAMYKVDGQGTDITLENTSENKFVEFGLEGRTEQEQLSGKNLLPMADATTRTNNGITVVSDGKGKFKITGTATDIARFTFFVNEVTMPNETLYCHLRNSQVNAVSLIIGNTQSSSSPSCSSVNRIMQSSILSNLLVQYIAFQIPNGTIVDMTLEPSIELTDNITDYEQYCGGIPAPNLGYECPIKNVTGNANCKIQNKNLLPELWFTQNRKTISINGVTATINVDNTITLTGTATERTLLYFKPFNLKFGAGTYQYISNSNANLRIESTLITDGAIAYANSFNNTPFERTAQKSFEITGSALIIGEGQATNTILYFFVQEKNIDTSYVEHQEQNYPFTFAKGQRGMQGTQLLDDGIHNSRVHVIVNGTENIILSTATVGTSNYGKFDVTISKRANLNDKTALCSHLKYKFQGWTAAGNENTFSFTTATTLRLLLDINEFPTVEALKTYLANNNMTFEFVTEQPEIIPYNETQQAQYNAIKQATSYDDITIISSESDELGFNMNVVAVADANKVIDKELQEIKSAVIALGGDLNV